MEGIGFTKMERMTPKKTSCGAGLKTWNAHVAQVRKANPSLSFSQALKKASASYKK